LFVRVGLQIGEPFLMGLGALTPEFIGQRKVVPNLGYGDVYPQCLLEMTDRFLEVSLLESQHPQRVQESVVSLGPWAEAAEYFLRLLEFSTFQKPESL
jgi:hypothetical protein